ncbi:hypothetical protein Tco_0337711, partial [Tanacetum coccineum]
MEELCQPTMLSRGGPIVPMTMQAMDFGLKNHMIQQVQHSCQYHGLPWDDANKHIDKFLTVTQNIKQNGVRHDVPRFCLFPYSLTHHATSWFEHLPKNSIHSWEEMVTKFLSKNTFLLRCFNQTQGQNFNQNQAQSNFSSTDDILRQHIIAFDAKFQLLATQMIKIKKAFNERPQGALPSNTIPNPREEIKVITTRSGITLAGPSVLPPPPSSSKEVERDLETTMNQVHISSPESTARVASPVIQPAPASKASEIPKRNPHQPPIPYPSTLAHMPKYAKMLKDLLSNKDKLLELANTPLNKNCLAILLNKLPEKLRDFLIPCDFSKLEECMALADLVGKFTFPADFVVVDYDVDPHVPLILGRPFLRMECALVDVYGEELILRVGDEKLTFNVDITSKYSHKHENKSINLIDIIDTTCEDHFHE